MDFFFIEIPVLNFDTLTYQNNLFFGKYGTHCSCALYWFHDLWITIMLSLFFFMFDAVGNVLQCSEYVPYRFLGWSNIIFWKFSLPMYNCFGISIFISSTEKSFGKLTVFNFSLMRLFRKNSFVVGIIKLFFVQKTMVDVLVPIRFFNKNKTNFVGRLYLHITYPIYERTPLASRVLFFVLYLEFRLF